MVGNVSLRVACSHLTASQGDGDGYQSVIHSLLTPVSQHEIVSVFATPRLVIPCLPCWESASPETLRFTYHIQTAFVLSICHFHALDSHPPTPCCVPLLSASLSHHHHGSFCSFSCYWTKRSDRNENLVCFPDEWPLVVMRVISRSC